MGRCPVWLWVAVVALGSHLTVGSREATIKGAKMSLMSDKRKGLPIQQWRAESNRLLIHKSVDSLIFQSGNSFLNISRTKMNKANKEKNENTSYPLITSHVSKEFVDTRSNEMFTTIGTCEAIYGFFQLPSGFHVVIVQESDDVLSQQIQSHSNSIFTPSFSLSRLKSTSSPYSLPYRRVSKVELIRIPNTNYSGKLSLLQEEEEKQSIKLLKDMFSSHDFYFASHPRRPATGLKQRRGKEVESFLPNFDITLNCQQCFQNQHLSKNNDSDTFSETNIKVNDITGENIESSHWKNSDDRFFWNKQLLVPLINQVENISDKWITPISSAFISCHEVAKMSEIKQCKHTRNTNTINGGGDGGDRSHDDNLESTTALLYVLISRRSKLRQGTRFLRGVDDNGDVANFVETEQILLSVIPEECAKNNTKNQIVHPPINYSQPVANQHHLLPAKKHKRNRPKKKYKPLPTSTKKHRFLRLKSMPKMRHPSKYFSQKKQSHHATHATPQFEVDEKLHKINKIASHVQVRGSIPLFWGHPSHLRLKPPVRLFTYHSAWSPSLSKSFKEFGGKIDNMDSDHERSDNTGESQDVEERDIDYAGSLLGLDSVRSNKLRNMNALKRHVTDLRCRYGRQVTFLNLIDKQKEQGKLGRLLKNFISELKLDDINCEKGDKKLDNDLVKKDLHQINQTESYILNSDSINVVDNHLNSSLSIQTSTTSIDTNQQNHLQQVLGVLDEAISKCRLDTNEEEKRMFRDSFGASIQNTKKASSSSKTTTTPLLNYIWFDFHKECHGRDWSNLSKIETLCKDILIEDGLFTASLNKQTSLSQKLAILKKEKLVKKKRADNDFDDLSSCEWQCHSQQKGVVRSNCMDCLDRTNVVQAEIAKFMLKKQWLFIEPASSTSCEKSRHHYVHNNKLVNHMFRRVWSANADVIAKLYAGSSAMKGDFTQSGKRTKLGAIKDLMYGSKRYFLNHFTDPRRQSGLDFLILGVRDPDRPSLSAEAVKLASGSQAAVSIALKALLSSFILKYVLLGL